MKQIIVATVLLCFTLSLLAQDVVLLSNKQLSKQEALDAVTFKTSTFKDGSKIHVLVLPETSYATRELSRVIGIPTSRYMFQARMLESVDRVTFIDTPRELIYYMARNEGVVGYSRDMSIFDMSFINVINLR